MGAIGYCLCDLDRLVGQADVIINATSVGMRERDGRIIDGRSFKEPSCVFDIVYNRETELLRDARSAGAIAIDGVMMLVYQGARAFEIWTGRKAPVDVMERAVRESLEERETKAECQGIETDKNGKGIREEYGAHTDTGRDWRDGFLVCPLFQGKGMGGGDLGAEREGRGRRRLGVRYAQDMMAEVEKSDVVLVSVIIEKTVEVIQQVAPRMQSGSLIMDVTSVKSGPVKAMKTYAPKGVEVLGTHPMFGPTMPTLSGQTIIFTPVEGKTGKWLPSDQVPI